jgi:Trypsin-like peptidase domain
MRTWAASLVLPLVLAPVGCTTAGAPTATQAQTAAVEVPAPTAAPVNPDPRVGAVFLGGGTSHTCSGSVLHSATGDLVLTAAHCLAQGVDTNFVPAFRDDAAGPDVWKVGAVYLDPRWVADQDPLADYAIVRVSRDGGGSIEAQTGTALTLGVAPVPGTPVTVTGYPFGTGGGPVSCQSATATTPAGYPSLQCGGLVDGTSGAPWISGSTVTGVIGGLDGGGCDENLSYSPPFDGNVARLLARAEAGGPGDAAPVAFDADC